MTSEDNQVNMVQQEDTTPVTMEGYLEKRGKMKLVSTWKRYWFVLKGQLLLYYKTQHECNNLSVCRGSLNMGLASCVRPGANRGPSVNGTQGYTIEVVTRTQVVILAYFYNLAKQSVDLEPSLLLTVFPLSTTIWKVLASLSQRTKDRSLQEQWLKGLLDSMALSISTPIRNSTGPMHFRYSLDNLPVIEEAESEDKNLEKQCTLPHGASISRRDSILGRIKRIGGTSYGGSLETVIKRRPNTQQPQQQSPQQPKIPRIKAVDRMLGMHEASEETCKENKKQDKDTLIPKISPQNGAIKSSKNVNYAKIKHEKNDTSNSDAELQTTSSGDIYATSKKSESIEEKPENSKHITYSEVVKNNNGNKSYTRKNDQNQNCEEFCVTKSAEPKNVTWSMIENAKHVIYIEGQEDIVIENKLYDKSIKTRNEGSNAESGDNERNQTAENINGKSEQKKKGDKAYDSEEELSQYPNITCNKVDYKEYEEVKVSETCVKQNEIEECDEEDYYYSEYDKFSLLKSLSDQEHEPTLPPRPSVSSKSSNEFMRSVSQNNVNKDDEDVEYNSLYETTVSCSKLESPAGETSPRQKNKSKLHKLRTKKKKSPNKESVDLEDECRNTGIKKKRKISFLRRMLKHYRKKPNSQTSVDDGEDSEDPEYESVNYSTALTVQIETENDAQTQSAPSEIESLGGSPDKETHKERIFGTNLLSEQGMKELKMKLKVRDDPAPSPAVLQTEEGKESVSSDDIRDKKPIPNPRSNKQKAHHQTGVVTDIISHTSEGIDRPNKPPKLPPRKVGRPPSPWHDVPKNNSPIYGNFQDLAMAVPQNNAREIEESSENKAEMKTEEWNQDIEDDLLGTPLGFAYIQNKWKAAEKSGELTNKDMLSPGKNRSLDRNSEECKGKRTRSASSSSGKCSIKSDCSDAEKNCSTSEVYTEIQRLSAKSIIKNFNSQSNRIVETNTSSHLNKNMNESKCNSVLVKVESSESLKISNTHDTKFETCVKCNNDIEKSETTVTLRKSQDIACQKIELDHSDLHNKNPPSSHICSKDIRGEFRKRSDSSTQTSQISLNGSLNNADTKEVCGNGIDVEGEEYDIMPRLNRHSDELNILLAQLAEITSAPLLSQGVATSLSDIPDGKKSKLQAEKPPEPSQSQPEQFVLGPIRRRRHSDPDYDVPRPHGSLMHLLAANGMSNRSSQSQSGQESDPIEATHFFGEQDIISSSGRSSLSLRHSVISEVDDQSDTSYYVSMAPDSLEVQVKDVEGVYT